MRMSFLLSFFTSQEDKLINRIFKSILKKNIYNTNSKTCTILFAIFESSSQIIPFKTTVLSINLFFSNMDNI